MLRRIVSRRRAAPGGPPPPDWGDPSTTPEDRAIIEAALPHTMTGPARLQALVDAVRYCVARDIPGAFAECGVWRGGSVLAIILTLQQLGADDRDLWLYDTFEGMTEPTEHDVSPVEAPALESWRAAGGRPYPELFSGDFGEEQVRRMLAATGYDERRLRVVAGPVERTLPEHAPEQLALLRLDTDWYESTRAEIEHLYPRLVAGGVLIVDDWGHWEGARRAVEEHLAAHGGPLLLHRIDYTARIGIKA